MALGALSSMNKALELCGKAERHCRRMFADGCDRGLDSDDASPARAKLRRVRAG